MNYLRQSAAALPQQTVDLKAVDLVKRYGEPLTLFERWLPLVGNLQVRAPNLAGGRIHGRPAGLHGGRPNGRHAMWQALSSYDASLSTPALEYLASWLEFQRRLHDQPGCVVAVAYRGRVVLEQAFGYADLRSARRSRRAIVFVSLRTRRALPPPES